MMVIHLSEPGRIHVYGRARVRACAKRTNFVPALLAKSPDSTQAGRGPQWPIQLAAISAHPAAMVGTGMPKLRGRTGNEAIAMPTAPSLERDSAAGRRTPGN